MADATKHAVLETTYELSTVGPVGITGSVGTLSTTSMLDALEPFDLAHRQKLRQEAAQLTQAATQAQIALATFDRYLAEKYALAVGKDQVHQDGTIVRAVENGHKEPEALPASV